MRRAGSRAPWRARRELPGYFTSPGVDVRHAREHEQEIGQAIEVNDDQRWNLDVSLKRHHPSLSAAANCPRHVKDGALTTSAGNDEGLERLQLLLALID